jgi:hypothetical protein
VPFHTSIWHPRSSTDLAKHAYRASAQIIRTADEMQKTLLDALA